jgi:hypothetical protein
VTIEWRATYFGDNTTAANFEVVLFENQSSFNIIYGTVGQYGSSATVGVQRISGGPQSTTWECNTGGLKPGLMLTFAEPDCGPPPPTPTPSPTPSCGVPTSHHILILYADSVPPNTLRADILAQSGIGVVDLFDARTVTPTLALLQQYDTVVAFSNSAWGNNATIGSLLADYQDGGGAVVAMEFVFDNRGSWQLGGRWATAGYSPYNFNSATNFSTGSLGTSAGGPLMAGVSNLNAFYRGIFSPATGATQIATWNDGTSLIALKGQAVGVTGYAGDSVGGWSGDFGRLIANAANLICLVR